MTSLSLDQIDLSDLSHFRAGAPLALFTQMRAEAPVHWSHGPGGEGFWSLTRHADVLAVSRAPDDFKIEPHGNMIFDQFGEGDVRERVMLEFDAPAHTRYRSLVNRDFSSRRLTRIQDFAEKRVGEILDEAIEGGDIDFVDDVAARLPTAVIAELMGVPEVDRAALYDIANRVMAFSDPEYSDATGGANLAAIGEMLAFAADLARERRRAPRKDLMSQLLEAEIDGDRLRDSEIEHFFFLLVTAGIETTRSAIAAGMLAFDAAPEQWARLRAGTVGMKSAVEEVVRYTAPIHHFRRTASRDLEIAGQEIKAGERVVVWYSSANRDESAFRNAAHFDVGRWPNEHLSFGFGRHFCLGASLARLEIETLLQGLIERDVGLECTGQVDWMLSNFAQSPKRMPVRLSRGRH